MANVTLLPTSDYFHVKVEQDKADPSNILYVDGQRDFFLNNGTTDYTLADNLDKPWGFCQISCTEIILADSNNYCLQKIDRFTGNVSEFSGVCHYYKDSELKYPTDVVIDKMNRSQLLVADSKTVKSVELSTGNVSVFAQAMENVKTFWGLAQTENGDIYLVDYRAIYKAEYFSRSIVLVAGSPSVYGSTDGSLAQSTFRGIVDIEFITPHAVLVTDYENRLIRLVDFIADKVTSIDVCAGVPSECIPLGLSITNATIYIGTNDILILPCK